MCSYSDDPTGYEGISNYPTPGDNDIPPLRTYTNLRRAYVVTWPLIMHAYNMDREQLIRELCECCRNNSDDPEHMHTDWCFDARLSGVIPETFIN